MYKKKDRSIVYILHFCFLLIAIQVRHNQNSNNFIKPEKNKTHDCKITKYIQQTQTTISMDLYRNNTKKAKKKLRCGLVIGLIVGVSGGWIIYKKNVFNVDTHKKKLLYTFITSPLIGVSSSQIPQIINNNAEISQNYLKIFPFLNLQELNKELNNKDKNNNCFVNLYKTNNKSIIQQAIQQSNLQCLNFIENNNNNEITKNILNLIYKDADAHKETEDCKNTLENILFHNYHYFENHIAKLKKQEIYYHNKIYQIINSVCTVTNSMKPINVSKIILFFNRAQENQKDKQNTQDITTSRNYIIKLLQSFTPGTIAITAPTFNPNEQKAIQIIIKNLLFDTQDKKIFNLVMKAVSFQNREDLDINNIFNIEAHNIKIGCKKNITFENFQNKKNTYQKYIKFYAILEKIRNICEDLKDRNGWEYIENNIHILEGNKDGNNYPTNEDGTDFPNNKALQNILDYLIKKEEEEKVRETQQIKDRQTQLEKQNTTMHLALQKEKDVIEILNKEVQEKNSKIEQSDRDKKTLEQELEKTNKDIKTLNTKLIDLNKLLEEKKTVIEQITQENNSLNNRHNSSIMPRPYRYVRNLDEIELKNEINKFTQERKRHAANTGQKNQSEK